MNAIVTIVGGQAVTTTPAIADGTAVDHASVIKLVRTYRSDLEEFGGVGFEIQPFGTAGGTQQREIARLNEQQATLVMTYMRNSDSVREFKKRLVKAFWDMARQLTQPAVPQSLPEALRLAADQAEQLALAAPKVEFVDRYVASPTGAKGIREVCKVLNANEREFTRFLVDEQIMYRLAGKLTPHSSQKDTGRFVVRTGQALANEHQFEQAKFTPKGFVWVAGQWAKYKAQGGMAA